MKPMTGKQETEVTLAGGGNETFAALTRQVLRKTYGVQFVDAATGGIGATLTITMEVSYDGSNWETLVDSAGNDVTGTLAQSGQLQFHHVTIPHGAYVRPKFVTDTTGKLTMTSYV